MKLKDMLGMIRFIWKLPSVTTQLDNHALKILYLISFLKLPNQFFLFFSGVSYRVTENAQTQKKDAIYDPKLTQNWN